MFLTGACLAGMGQAGQPGSAQTPPVTTPAQFLTGGAANEANCAQPPSLNSP